MGRRPAAEVAVVGLLGIALIHLLDVKDKLDEVRYIGALFICLFVACLILANALLYVDDLRVRAATGLVAGATIVGYCLSRSVGLPGKGDAEVGNWSEGLGLASLLVEGIVVWLALSRLRGPRR